MYVGDCTKRLTKIYKLTEVEAKQLQGYKGFSDLYSFLYFFACHQTHKYRSTVRANGNYIQTQLINTSPHKPRQADYNGIYSI